MVLEKVHSTCAAAAHAHREHIQIDEDAVQRLASELPAEQVKASVSGMLFPVKFESVEQEVTLMALYHMLDFGSGYDAQLLRRGQRNMRDTLQYGMIGLHISGSNLDAHRLKAFGPYDVHSFLGIEAREDVEVMPGITMSKPGPLQPLTTSIVAALNEAGTILLECGSKSMGEYILSYLSAQHKSRGRVSADALVLELVDTYPTFDDKALYDGSTVYFYRKAQALVADLAARFGRSDPRFAFDDLGQLASDSGNVTPAVLRAKGVLKLSDELAGIINAGEELPAGPHERALRAATVAACDAVVAAAAAAGGGGTAPAPYSAAQLGAYLCFLTEEGQELHGAKLHKHLTPGQTAY